MKRLISLVLVFLISFSFVFADTADSSVPYKDDILVSDIPITYGDAGFRERILQRTNGERDPIGLILTGGSARACAHIGVLKYLEEQGIVPDFIISNSMGSIIGMLYAAGLTPDQIEQFMLSGDISNFFDITLPIRGGLVVPAGFKTMINSIVGDDFRIEDTEIPIMVVCEDLVTKREIRIAEGNFSDILIASFALPVYFDPQVYRGHYLIDGGVVSLAPIDAAYDYSDTIILSTAFYDVPEMNLVNPITILNASFDVGKRQKASSDMKVHDNFIWIRCGVENFSFMAFDRAVEMAEIGYGSAAEKKSELDKLYKAGSVSEELNALRAEKQPLIDKVNKNLYYFERVESTKPITLLGFGFGSKQDSASPYYLSNTTYLNLRYGFNYRGLECGAGAGVGFDTYDLSRSQTYFTTGGTVSYYPLENMRIGGEFYTDLGRKNAGWKPTLFFRQSFDYIPISTRDRFRLAVHQTMEYYKDYADIYGTASLFSIGMDGKYVFSWGNVWTKNNLMVAGDSIIFGNSKAYMQLSGGARAFVDPSHTIYIDASAFSRFTLDGRGSVPLFFSDGYSSTMIGYGAFAVHSDVKYHNTIIGIASGYKLPFNPTFGEFLIFEATELGLYADMLIQDSHVGFSCGLDFQCITSLIGLVKFPMRLKLGYEYRTDNKSAFVSSLIFAVKY